MIITSEAQCIVDRFSYMYCRPKCLIEEESLYSVHLKDARVSSCS